MATCHFCDTTFSNRQAVRAHLKGCPGYQARKTANQPEGKGNQVTRAIGKLSSRQSREPKARVSKLRDQQIMFPDVGSRLKEEEVETVLCLYEELRVQRQKIIESLPIRRLLATAQQWDSSPSYEDWYGLAKEILHLEQGTDCIVTQARISRDEPWTLHKLALSIRERWVFWRREEALRMYESEQKAAKRAGKHLKPDRLDEIIADFRVLELEASWGRIIDGLRWLTIHTKATL